MRLAHRIRYAARWWRRRKLGDPLWLDADRITQPARMSLRVAWELSEEMT